MSAGAIPTPQTFAGHLVEVLSGQRLDDYLQEHIFSPLDMVDTAFSVSADSRTRFAANYARQSDRSLKLIDDPLSSDYLSPPSFLSGGGGLTGTTSDYFKFCEMLRHEGSLNGHQIIGSRTLRLMRQNHLPAGADLSQKASGGFSETAYQGVGFGLGFAMTLDEVATAGLGTGDYYWGGAASTIFWVDPTAGSVGYLYDTADAVQYIQFPWPAEKYHLQRLRRLITLAPSMITRPKSGLDDVLPQL